MIQLVARAEAWFENACLEAGRALTLLADTVRALREVRLRFGEIVNQCFRATYGSLPVTVLTALFSGAILALGTGMELAKYGQEATIGYVVAASMCREMGPVMTAIALAGLMGSSYAAELGTMKVSEEIDALEVMSISPVRFLVMPRVVSLVAASLALTILVNVIGIVGGAIVSVSSFGVAFDTYFTNAQDILKLHDIWMGLLKAGCFALSTALVGCTMGLSTTGGAAGVGRSTQKTVVISFVMVLILDYLLTKGAELMGVFEAGS
ncbi:MAG TPA: ABC transporter permease [Planctomycetota bacterium]|nr:ABC transporter permease [Planctomycetota bacterium]